ncbi:DUF6011 domain-containing protein [Alicyclobacillus fructus]|uniref:DUF6011 domain-containing protein n=1 Tax=Alicyclobacillus fructus TaxID=2816082 RepID=UPI001F27C3D4|nr:DUF6011 domain-containing protein [Alicyclobacillus fructus]
MLRCVRCGRPLRSPSSIRHGAGPACAKLLLRQIGVEGRMSRGWSASSDERVRSLLTTEGQVGAAESSHRQTSSNSARVTSGARLKQWTQRIENVRISRFEVSHVTQKYDNDFKLHAVQLALKGHKPASEIARDLRDIREDFVWVDGEVS